MKPKVYIDGKEGTTGLQIYERLGGREDMELLLIEEEKRKDVSARKRLLNQADLVFLCLPDAAAAEAVSMIENEHTRVIDASTAHRTAPGWVYGFPELTGGQRQKIAEARYVANPGCFATGFISLVHPLVELDLLPADALVTCHAVSGYTGAGKKAIAQYEEAGRDQALDSPRQYAMDLNHKHLPEMKAMTELSQVPLFNPMICDHPQGMVVTVPLFVRQLKAGQSADSIRMAYQDFYKGQTLISVQNGMPDSGFLAANKRAGSCSMELYSSGNEEQIVLCACFDNLGKGASGAAVQNMNLMLGFPETKGLTI